MGQAFFPLPPLSLLKLVRRYVKNGRRLLRGVISYTVHSFMDVHPTSDMRSALSPLSIAAVDYAKPVPFALRRRPRPQCLPSHSILPPPVAGFAALVIYSTHAEWQPASPQQNTCSYVSDVNLCTYWCCYFNHVLCLLRDTTHISLCSKVTRRAVISPDFIHFWFQL